MSHFEYYSGCFPIPVNNGEGREAHATQRARAMRALDVVAVQTLSDSSKDDPVTTVPYGFLISEADVNRATLDNEGFVWHVHKHSGTKYRRNSGEFTINCRSYLEHRKKLNRLDKIEENPEDHIFQEGGVSAD